MSEESREEEEGVAQVDLRLVVEVVNRELAQREHVLVVERVEDPVRPEDFLHNCVLVSSVQLKDVHGHAEHEESDEEDEEEVTDVVDRLGDQLDEEGGRSEQLTPVENFDPEAQS